MFVQTDFKLVDIFHDRNRFLSSSLDYRNYLNRLMTNEQRDVYEFCKHKIMHETCLNCIHFGILLRFSNRSSVE